MYTFVLNNIIGTIIILAEGGGYEICRYKNVSNIVGVQLVVTGKAHTAIQWQEYNSLVQSEEH